MLDDLFSRWFRSADEIFISECEDTGKEWGQIGAILIILIELFYHVLRSELIKVPFGYLFLAMCLSALAPLFMLGQWIGTNLGETFGDILGWLGLRIRQLLNNDIPQVMPGVLATMGAVLGLLYDGLIRLIFILCILMFQGSTSSGNQIYTDAFGPILSIGLLAIGAVIGYSIGLDARPVICRTPANQWWDGSEK